MNPQKSRVDCAPTTSPSSTSARRAGLGAHNVEGGMNAWERNGLDMDITGRTA